MANKLEVEPISRSLFDKLPEYSCTLPTGTRIGKVWKRKRNYYDESQGWLIGEYVTDPQGDPSMVGIQWREPKIIEGK